MFAEKDIFYEQNQFKSKFPRPPVYFHLRKFNLYFKLYPEDDPDAPNQLCMAFNASLEILTSKEFKISGCISPVSSLRRKSPNVSDITIGVGGTNVWSLGAIDNTTTLAIYYDITNPGNAQLSHDKHHFT